MNHILKKLADLFVYSSLNIAVAACLFSAEVFFIFDLELDYAFLGFVFVSTILTYSLHRIIGIRLMKSAFSHSRFETISNYKFLIWAIAVIAFIALLILSWNIDRQYLIHFFISGLICFLYVLPVMHKRQRLRDLPFLKIFVISLVWTYVANMPLFLNEINQIYIWIVILLSLEKLIYIFYVTIPFDIRDLAIDATQKVKTIPGRIGTKKSYKLILVSIIINMILWILIVYTLQLDIYAILCIATSVIVSVGSIYLSMNKSSDLYYSGLIDGIISIRSLLIILAFSLN